MSLENLKSSRGSSIDKLVQAAEAVSTKTETKSYDDDRFWKPTRDKAGNGYAVIRFLPAKEGEDLPWVRYWDHGFKGPTGLWYIENRSFSLDIKILFLTAINVFKRADISFKNSDSTERFKGSGN